MSGFKSLYRVFYSHKLVHNIDRQNKWYSALWRHYDVMPLVKQIFEYFMTRPKWLSSKRMVIRPCILSRSHLNSCIKWMIMDQLWRHYLLIMEKNLFFRVYYYTVFSITYILSCPTPLYRFVLRVNLCITLIGKISDFLNYDVLMTS